jgi:hypothetical protein
MASIGSAIALVVILLLSIALTSEGSALATPAPPRLEPAGLES